MGPPSRQWIDWWRGGDRQDGAYESIRRMNERASGRERHSLETASQRDDLGQRGEVRWAASLYHLSEMASPVRYACTTREIGTESFFHRILQDSASYSITCFILLAVPTLVASYPSVFHLISGNV